MTAAKIIDEINKLSHDERDQVMKFLLNSREDGQLSGEELERLAQQMVETADPAEAEKLRAAIVRGFYGKPRPSC